jgi:hypothetical protein
MKSGQIALLLLAAAPSFAAKYDPDPDRIELRRSAAASYDAAVRAAGLSLEPGKIPEIKASLDDSVAQARLSSSTANGLDADAARRSAEMDAALKPGSGLAPDAAAKAAADAAGVQRARWKTLSSDQDDLTARIRALPDKNPDGSRNRTKAELEAALGRASASLGTADRSLASAETGAAGAPDAAAAMALARKRAKGPDAERAAADAEIQGLSALMPPPFSDAKAAVDRIGLEPQGVNRTHAVEKLVIARDLARELQSAADRACNRAEDFHALSTAFAWSAAAFASAGADGAAALSAAKTALDDAAKTQAGARDRLDRPKP